MFLKSQKIDKFFLITFFLFAFIGSFWIYSIAQDKVVVVEKQYPNEVIEVNDDPFGEYDESYLKEANRGYSYSKKSRSKRSMPAISDSYFHAGSEVTFAKLILNMSMIVLFLLGLLIITRMFLRRDGMASSSGIINNLTQKVKKGVFTFDNKNKIAIQETYMLAPGQVLYVVEINGRKLLLGVTNQGGIHYLTDLSAKVAGELDFKEIEMLQQQKQDNDFADLFEKPQKSFKGINPSLQPMQSDMVEVREEPIFKQQIAEERVETSKKVAAKESSSVTQSFRQRRAQFRQSLLSSRATRR
ncbi:MAG: flagellar biosynthetic protein FliO [Candidatus Melainabacteria bacterium]|nr:flagellar biosynthetic protein FliO [Candidatus Melainabacteria bacterium]